MQEVWSFDPRLRALYLLAVAVGVFFLPQWWMVAAVLAVQLALWMVVGLSIVQLLRQLRKLVLFLAVILLAYALVAQDPQNDHWVPISIFGFTLEFNAYGAIVGLTMVLRILCVVLASHVIRAGDARALADGLRKLGVPHAASQAIDAVLVLLGEGRSGAGGGRRGGGGGGGHGGGGGGGGPKGGNRERTESPRGVRGFWQGVTRLARGDVSIIADGVFRQIRRAEDHVLSQAETAGDAERSRDIAVVAGVALMMLGIKALKLLPGLPFAPGHKGVLLIPLFIVAGYMTKSRWGATLTGLTMGVVAFLLGDGRYGVFEIAKHIAPGLIVDLCMPLMRDRTAVWAWSCFGLVIALGRFATVTVIALTVQAPALVFAFLIPGLAVHASFGIISGIVTAPLVRRLFAEQQKRGDLIAAPTTSPDCPPPGDSQKRPTEAA